MQNICDKLWMVAWWSLGLFFPDMLAYPILCLMGKERTWKFDLFVPWIKRKLIQMLSTSYMLIFTLIKSIGKNKFSYIIMKNLDNSILLCGLPMLTANDWQTHFTGEILKLTSKIQ